MWLLHFEMECISIHSLVKRETLWRDYTHGDSQISIHSLVKRETNGLITMECDTVISIHSLVKRETARTAKQGTGAGISIHSLVKRETANFTKIWLKRFLNLCTFLYVHKKSILIWKIAWFASCIWQNFTVFLLRTPLYFYAHFRSAAIKSVFYQSNNGSSICKEGRTPMCSTLLS